MKKLCLIPFLFIFLLVGCGQTTSEEPAKIDLSSIKTWAYQIQNQNLDNNIQKLADSQYELLVIDNTRSLKGEEEYNNKADIEKIKATDKIVIGYIDIGEAESYRWYWKDDWKVGSPAFIQKPDPDGWDENYPVRFWENDWQKIILKSVDQMLDDGYDGIYMDWIEAYQDEDIIKAAEREKLNPEEEMLKFIRKIREHARATDSDFFLIAQNAVELIDNKIYPELIDAIGVENIWFDGSGDLDSAESEGDNPTSKENTEYYLEYMAKFKAKNIPIFTVDYAEKKKNADYVYQKSAELGFKPYVTIRSLKRLTETPPGF
ncbi:MJ1477/TM1410 family putative glycoside hydrolase [Patescibacteria group bacterium]